MQLTQAPWLLYSPLSNLERSEMEMLGRAKVSIDIAMYSFTDRELAEELGRLASLAEMERELTIERTRAGLEVARQLGRKGGRKRQMTESKIEAAKKLLASGVPPRDVAGNLGVSVPTLYRWIPASTQS